MSASASKHILVTGGMGYIGSRLVPWLLERGYRVRVLDLLTVPPPQVLSLLLDRPNFSLIVGDYRDPSVAEEATREISTVVHLAAVVGEQACESCPSFAQSVNATAVESFWRLCEKVNVSQFIYASSCSVYGVQEGADLADEQTPIGALSGYAQAKIDAERRIFELAVTGCLRSTLLRFGTVCGLSPRMRFDLLVNEMARNAALGRPVKIFAPDVWRPFLHVSDLCRVVEAVVSSGNELPPSAVYNAITENVTKRQLVAIARSLCPTLEIEIDEAQSKRDPRNYRVDDSRARAALGYSPVSSVADAFSEVFKAVQYRVFTDPFSEMYSAVPKLDWCREER